MLVLGDAHAESTGRQEALLAAYRETDADVALQLGDLEHYDLPVQTYFVAGNNEDFDVIDALRSGYQPDGVGTANLIASTVVEVAGLRVAGLSGNFAPTRFEMARNELSGDRRRHFVREDVERAAELEDVDVFLTHEAPNGLLSYGYDPGCAHVDRILDALDPDLCLVGHHHRHREATIDGVETVCLAPVWDGYYRLDPEDLELSAHESPVRASAPR